MAAGGRRAPIAGDAREDLSVVRSDTVGRGGYSLGMRSERFVKPVLVRELIGESLREERVGQGKTLREVSKAARVSLGYLSEVERGQKEASSELLASICAALDLPLSVVLNVVSEKMAGYEHVTTLPDRTGDGPGRGLSRASSRTRRPGPSHLRSATVAAAAPGGSSGTRPPAAPR